MRGRDLRDRVLALGFGWELPPGSSHYRITNPNGRTVPVPLHNGLRTEIRPDQIRYIAKQLGLTVHDLMDS
jgi:predicted RNA binding protein YcfA (HicA-like mRNA interferase family)